MCQPKSFPDVEEAGCPILSFAFVAKFRTCSALVERVGISPAARSPALGLRFALALKIERHGSTDEVLQSRFIDLLALVDVDGAPDIPVEAEVQIKIHSPNQTLSEPRNALAA